MEFNDEEYYFTCCTEEEYWIEKDKKDDKRNDGQIKQAVSSRTNIVASW
jgi:hypothetical protein